MANMAELVQVLALMKYNKKYCQATKPDSQIRQSSSGLEAKDSNNNKYNDPYNKYQSENIQSRWHNMKQSMNWCGNNSANEK